MNNEAKYEVLDRKTLSGQEVVGARLKSLQ